MDHAYIDEHQVVDRYLMGRLSDGERGRFEEHYLSCSECLDQLETTESLARALKRAAGEDAAHVAARRQLAAVAWLARLGRTRQAALLLAAFLVLVLPPGLALHRAGELGRELADTRSRLAAAGTREDTELTAGRGELAREREARSRAEADLARAHQPQANVPILYLGAERGPAQGGEAAWRVHLPAKPGWVIFAVSVEPPYPATYHLALARTGAGEIWRGEAAGGQDTLTLSVPSSLLASGDHVLALSSVTPAGRGREIARYTFRVLPPA